MSTVMWREEENKAEKPKRDSANLSHSQVWLKSQSAEVQT